jgi:hypothetical protein
MLLLPSSELPDGRQTTSGAKLKQISTSPVDRRRPSVRSWFPDFAPGANQNTAQHPAAMSAIEKLAQAPLLNRLFRTPCTALQPLLDPMRHYGMRDARILYFYGKMGGRSRCTFVVAKRLQGEYSGLIERLGSDLDGVLNSIRIAERNGACLPGAHGRQNSIFVFCSPCMFVTPTLCGRPLARSHSFNICRLIRANRHFSD